MWANSSIETSYQNNFNVGFSTLRSDVLVHLTQWQYWWWFWFTFLWCFYYLLMIKIIKTRILKMRPKIATTYRPHSKWGDFLACTIPTIWCINILINSNLILRMIEWQNESSLFTIRIRGKQWYWIYRFELKSFTDILSTPKNIGSDRWLLNTFGDLEITENYIHSLNIKSQSKWIKNYWKNYLLKEVKQDKYHFISSTEQLKINLNNSIYNNFNIINFIDINSNELNLNLIYKENYNFSTLLKNYIFNNKLNEYFLYNNTEDDYYFKNFKKYKFTSLYNYNFNFLSYNYDNTINNFISPDLLEITRWNKRGFGLKIPFRLIKNNINNNDLIFYTKFGEGDNFIESKQLPHTKYLTIKQERSKKKKIVQFNKVLTEVNGNEDTGYYKGYQILNKNKQILNNTLDSKMQYKLFSKNRTREEKIPLTLTKRLLRTKKILVLPANVNITAITNSYDVVHSWFIPGMGLKLDCVPGRSTHHTFFIDNVGFYYGQCAEICGRYHHHMPIRICALPFEQFLVWWQSFGISKFMFSIKNNEDKTFYSFRKFIW